MEIWWRLAVLVTASLAAGLFLILLRARRSNLELDERVRALTSHMSTLHRMLDEQTAERRELAHRAAHDTLTGLPNRAVLLEKLEEFLPEAAILLIDIDNFGETNDSLGTSAGDNILVEVARRIKATIRHIDLVARLGRDEFAVVLPSASAERARLSAIRIMDSLRPACRTADGHKVRLTASVGVLPGGTHSAPAEALRDADLALSSARAAGRDRLVEFHPGLREERLRHARVAEGLRNALSSDELTLHYQPIVEMATGVPVAMEALARWNPAGTDPIPPAYFIPVAEQTGLVVPLGARILREACHQGKLWHDRYGTTIAVNISGRQLVEPDFTEYVLAVLGDTGLASGALTLEITETVMVSATGPEGQRMISHLERLRSHGVRVAIDDFGTGYSSLSYLHRLPIDMIKIDREFVAVLDGQDNPRGVMFAEAILRLGLSLGLDTVAEGVETRRQATVLSSLGCPLAQGYLFARPHDVQWAEQYLTGRRQAVST